jgi:hypothetical protein
MKQKITWLFDVTVIEFECGHQVTAYPASVVVGTLKVGDATDCIVCGAEQRKKDAAKAIEILKTQGI